MDILEKIRERAKKAANTIALLAITRARKLGNRFDTMLQELRMQKVWTRS